MRLLGHPPMPWQQTVLDTAMEMLPDGTPAYREVTLTIPRQQGKTTVVLAVKVHRAIVWRKQPQRAYYSAQTGKDGRQKLLDDEVPIILGSPLSKMLDPVRGVRRESGGEGLTFRNGSRIDVMASSIESGHGKTVDLGVIDEAFADVDDRREQAMIPAMMTRRDAQLWVVSTQGYDGSVYLDRKVQVGRAAVAEGLDRGVAYFEWSADPDAPIHKPETWRSCMPALDITIGEGVVRAALETMSEGEFRRAFLNQRTAAEERVIPLAVWNAVCGADVKPDGGLVFGIDATPDRSQASIVVVDRGHRAELVDHGVGVTWLEERVPQLLAEWGGQVAVDGRGPAASVLPGLEAKGVTVVKYGAGEMAGACARLYDAVADAQIKIRRHDRLDAAVAAARKRISGDTWTWARSSTTADISPLVALTVAYDLAVSSGRHVEPWAIWL